MKFCYDTRDEDWTSRLAKDEERDGISYGEAGLLAPWLDGLICLGIELM